MSRLFIALSLPKAARRPLLDLVPGGMNSLRRSRRDLLHLTLRFVGEAEETLVASALEAIPVPDHLELRIRGTGLFGTLENPRVLWAGLETTPGLAQLQESIEAALRSSGFPPEEREWAPHITVARVSRNRSLSQLERGRRDEAIKRFLELDENFSLPAFSVDGFTLFASETEAGLLHYRKVADFTRAKAKTGSKLNPTGHLTV